MGAVETAAALRSWLEREYGGTVLDAEAPKSIGTGFSTLIDYVRFAGRDLPPEWSDPLVARTHKTVEEAAVARREAAIQEWCVDQAYPAPRVIAVFDPGELGDLPVQVRGRVAQAVEVPSTVVRDSRLIVSDFAGRDDRHALVPAGMVTVQQPPDH